MDELTAVLKQSVTALQNRGEFQWSRESVRWKREFQQCRIAGISLLGLFPIDCPYSSAEIPAGDDSSNVPIPAGECQMNGTALDLALNLLAECGNLEFVALRDQGFHSDQITAVLTFFLQHIDRFPRLRLLQLGGSFVGRDDARAIARVKRGLEEKGVEVEGVALLDGGRFVPLRCR